jgi:16S rRNA (guanine(527)-N(7))-methyltransferase RsmG
MSERQELISAIEANQAVFDLVLSSETLDGLARYFELVQENNPLLHLVAPCTAEEFAIRHILESLTLLKHFPKNACFADVGTGAGLPSIPCLIVRGDLSAVLIESKKKKAEFLESALDDLGLADRAEVVNSQFEEIKEKPFSAVTGRALDRFSQKLPKLLRWSGKRTFLFFGGPSIEDALLSVRATFIKVLMPLSDQRYLFVGERQI